MDSARSARPSRRARYAREGVFQAWARRDPPTGGVLVAAAPDRASLEAIVAQDRYVRAGVARAEVVEFSPASVRGALGT
ncbi:MAG: YciI family protein [Gemmatimonadales bacterium]|nr:YciI family protein [Gemmatimonadales bacterium]